MKRKVLSAALTATLMLSNAVPSFAEGDYIPDIPLLSIEKPDIPDISSIDCGLNSTESSTQKILCIMLNLNNTPFKKEHNEGYYYEQLFGKKTRSLSTYVTNQSRGKFRVAPADTHNTKYPGVIKINVDASKYKTIGTKDYREQKKLVTDALHTIKSSVDWAKLDQDGNMQFKESYLEDSDYKEELLVVTVVSGNANSSNSRVTNQIKIWPHLSTIRTKLNQYTLDNTAIITSEFTKNTAISSATFSHEFLHNLHARDMYLDKNSVGIWSIMSNSWGKERGKSYYTPTPLDPIHRMYLGWSKPRRIDCSKSDIILTYSPDEFPYIQDPRNQSFIYILDYHDFNSMAEKSLGRYGVKSDGLVIWKVNKDRLKADWVDGDWYINTKGKKSSVWVMSNGKGGYSVKDSFTPVGQSKSIYGTLFKVDVRNKELVIHNRGV